MLRLFVIADFVAVSPPATSSSLAEPYSRDPVNQYVLAPTKLYVLFFNMLIAKRASSRTYCTSLKCIYSSH